MRSYLETQSDDVQHGDAEGQREIFVEYDPRQEGQGKEAKLCRQEIVKVTKLVCSCGSSKCPAIKTYGLPAAMFEREIRPIESQVVRDQRAKTLRQTVTLEPAHG